MSVSDQQAAFVQSTFELIADMPDTVASLFYAHLFEIDPSLRALFKGDMQAQGQMLMLVLAFAVHSLQNLDVIVPAVQDLGKRHVGYGVKKEDYNTVGTALLGTLEQGLGEHFTPEVKDAWTAVYTLIANTAIESAYIPETV